MTLISHGREIDYITRKIGWHAGVSSGAPCIGYRRAGINVQCSSIAYSGASRR